MDTATQDLLDTLRRNPGTTEGHVRSYLRGEHGSSAALDQAIRSGLVTRNGQKLFAMETK